MQFWIDMRLATDGGESVKRQRLTGEIRPEDFSEFCGNMVACLHKCAPDFESEEDSAQVGVGQATAAE